MKVIALCNMAEVHRQNFFFLRVLYFSPQDLSPNRRKSTPITNWRITFNWYQSVYHMCIISLCCCCCQVASVVSDSVRPHRQQPTRPPPPSPIPGILQARTLEWVAIYFSNAWKWKVKGKSLSPTLRNPMDCSLPGSSIHGIFQARVLEWGAIALAIPKLMFN